MGNVHGYRVATSDWKGFTLPMVDDPLPDMQVRRVGQNVIGVCMNSEEDEVHKGERANWVRKDRDGECGKTAHMPLPPAFLPSPPTLPPSLPPPSNYANIMRCVAMLL